MELTSDNTRVDDVGDVESAYNRHRLLGSTDVWETTTAPIKERCYGHYVAGLD